MAGPKEILEVSRRGVAISALLQPADILIDVMRGRSSTWTRVRLNLRNVPAEQRLEQEALEVDYDPWNGQVDRRKISCESATS